MSARCRLAISLLVLVFVFPAMVLAQGAPSFVATVTADGASLRKNASS